MYSSKTVLVLLAILLFSSNTDAFAGKRPKNPRIVNGSIVTSNLIFPYQVLISGGSDGGGTIVAKKWILTAAHVANAGSSLQLKAGVISRTGSGGQSVTYKQHIRHPAYNSSINSPLNDVALIEVNESFTYNGEVDAVKLASANNSGLWAVGNQPIVSGFGKISSGGSLSNELRRVNVQITSVDNRNSKIRAGGNGGNDSCQGDSGGPLTASNTQIGIVSSGGTCGTGGDYMMVSKYLDFITQTIHLFGTPDLVCGSTTFENLSNLPDGVSFQWSASPSNYFTLSSGSGLTFTTANNGSPAGKGTITLTVTTPTGTYTHNKEVWVGKPAPVTLTTDGTFSISGNSTSICKGLGYCMTASSTVALQLTSSSPSTNTYPISNKNYATATGFSYSGWPTFNSFFNTSTVSVSNDRTCFGTNNTGSYFLTINASNACGTGSVGSIIVQVNNCGYRVFPNPAQTTLAIEFENPELVESIPDLVEIQEEKSQKVIKSKDLKTMKEKYSPTAYSRVDFDVANLPRGGYYVQMTYDERSQRQKETIRIILTE